MEQNTQNPEQKTETPPMTPPKEEKKEEPKETVKEIHHHHYHERHGFNFGRFLLGLIIVAVGLVFLARVAGWNIEMNFNWNLLWPFFVIIIGLSMISFRGWLGTLLGILATLVVIGFVLAIIFGAGNFAGSTNITTQERQASDFNKISLNGFGNLFVEQGDKESLKIEAQDNIISRIQTRVEDQTLKIDYDWNWNWWPFLPQKPVNIYVTVKDINKITTAGAVTIKSAGLKTNNLEIDLSGASKADLSIEVNQLTVQISGAGQLEYIGSPQVTQKISGVGKVNKIEE